MNHERTGRRGRVRGRPAARARRASGGGAGTSESPSALAEALRASAAFRAKVRIRGVALGLGRGMPGGIRNGDDAAAIPDENGWLLLAADGILPELVERDPYLAGRCAVLANVNDVYAMGGRPTAMVDVLGAPSDQATAELCRGLRDGAARYGVPIVGGHLLRTARGGSLAVAILGRARALITSFDARPGDRLLLVTHPDGRWVEPDGFWNATLARNDAALVENLELLPAAAEAGREPRSCCRRPPAWVPGSTWGRSLLPPACRWPAGSPPSCPTGSSWRSAPGPAGRWRRPSCPGG